MKVIKCPRCKKKREVSSSSASNIKRGKAKGYCKACVIWRLKNIGNVGQYKKGHVPFTKGTKGFVKVNSGSFKKGENVGEKHPFWKGGRAIQQGYIYIREPNHPRCQGNTRRYVPEQVLIMEKLLGRYLNPQEAVHHINGIRNDNRIENLIIMHKNAHNSLHLRERTNNFKKILTKEYLVTEYNRKNKIMRIIAKEVGCSRRTVLLYINKYGLNK